jgi:hypothetical protein
MFKLRMFYNQGESIGGGNDSPPPVDTAQEPSQESGETQETPTSTTFTQEQLNQIVGSRLAEERQRNERKYGDLEALLKKAKLADDSSVTIQQIQDQLETARLDNMRLEVGVSKGLPVSVASVLKGKTREDMEQHADQIRKELNLDKRIPPPSGATAGPHTPVTPATSGLSATEINMAKKFGISPEDYAAAKKLMGT